MLQEAEEKPAEPKTTDTKSNSRPADTRGQGQSQGQGKGHAIELNKPGVSPVLKQWHERYRINRSLSSIRNDFNYLHHQWINGRCKCIFMFLKN